MAGKLTRLAHRVETGAVIPTRSPTVSQYLSYWLTEVAEPKLRPTTIAKYRTAIELYLRPGVGHHRLDKLTVATVQRFLNGSRDAGDSVPKLRMMREVLSSALGRALREELIARNVAQLTTLPVEHRARRTAWTAAEARSFLRAAAEDSAYPVFVLAVVYGMRRGEIAALQWEVLHFTRDRLAVRASLVRVGGRLVRGPVKTAAGVRMLPLVALPGPRCSPSGRTRPNGARLPARSGSSRDTSSLRAAGGRSSRETSRAPSTGSSPGRACRASCSTTCDEQQRPCSRTSASPPATPR